MGLARGGISVNRHDIQSFPSEDDADSYNDPSNSRRSLFAKEVPPFRGMARRRPHLEAVPKHVDLGDPLWSMPRIQVLIGHECLLFGVQKRRVMVEM